MDILKGLLAYAIQTGTGATRPISVNGSDELIVSLGSFTTALDVQGTSADGDPHDGSDPVNVGGKVSAADPTYLAGDKAELSMTLDGRARVNSDIEQIGGVAVATGAISGTFIPEGTSADADPHDGSNPLNIAGKASAADPTYLAGDKAELSMTLDGRARVNNDIEQIAGNAVAGTGETGTVPIEGTVASGAAEDSAYPVPIAAVTRQVLTALTDARVTKLFTDLYGRQHVRDAAFNSLDSANKVEVVNNMSTDFDDNDLIGSESNMAAGNNYYPNQAGQYIGTQNSLALALELNQCYIDFEVSVEGGTGGVWINATKMLTDVAQGAHLFDNTHYNEAAGVTANFGVSWERMEWSYYRIVAVRNNATNSIEIRETSRANC